MIASFENILAGYGLFFTSGARSHHCFLFFLKVKGLFSFFPLLFSMPFLTTVVEFRESLPTSYKVILHSFMEFANLQYISQDRGPNVVLFAISYEIIGH